MSGPKYAKINYLLIFMAISVVVCVMWIFSPHSQYLNERGDDDVMLMQGTLCAGMLLWPVVWDMLIGYDSLTQQPILLLAFLWPILVSLYQIMDRHHDEDEDLSNSDQRRRFNIMGVQGDASTLISIAFAMGGIFMVMPHISQNKNMIRNAAYIVVVALLFCIALILPTTNNVINSQRYTHLFRNIQRVAINYSLGLIMAALLIVVLARYDAIVINKGGDMTSNSILE
jgi:hypothetical protein